MRISLERLNSYRSFAELLKPSLPEDFLLGEIGLIDRIAPGASRAFLPQDTTERQTEGNYRN